MMEPLDVLFKSEPSGSFSATFTLFNRLDLHGDVTVAGAFAEQIGERVPVGGWNHNNEDLPVGVGVLHADQQRGWIEGRFFTESPRGREHFDVVKALGERQQWSYGLLVLDSSKGDWQGQPVRFLKKVRVLEVSPVFLGAQPATRTERVGVKSGALVALKRQFLEGELTRLQTEYEVEANQRAGLMADALLLANRR